MTKLIKIDESNCELTAKELEYIDFSLRALNKLMKLKFLKEINKKSFLKIHALNNYWKKNKK